MPVLNINEDEKNAVIAALHHERVRLTGEWSRAFDDEESSVIYRDSELDRLAAAIDLTTDLRRKIEGADASANTWPVDPILGPLTSRLAPEEADRIDISINGSPRLRCTIRKSESAALLEDIIQTAHASINRLDAESVAPVTEPEGAWHHKHGWLPSTLNKLEELKAFDDARNEATAARRRISEQLTAFHETKDLKPSTWTTLPEDFEGDDWMFDVTDPEPTTAGIDVQTKDGKVSIYLQVGGECRELHGDADAVEQLLRQLELGTRLQSECIRRDETGRAYLDPSAVVS